MTDPIKIRTEGAILEVTLDRPKANAIDLATSRIMGEVFRDFRDNPDLRVAIITGAGEKFFCPGWDLKAAADGAVVYSGRGLIGYGDMIIIKHDETYLSAYAHNSRLLVKEGDQVKVGQVIAEMGSSGTDRVKLHFEIRRKGQPVDPLAYLPRI